MRQTVVGVFERHATAHQAAQQLRESGFGESVFVIDEITAAQADAPKTPDQPREDGSFIAQVRGFFADLFDGKNDDASPYTEALRRGGGVVKVEVTAERELEAARAALEAAGARSIDQCASQWRAAGSLDGAGPVREDPTDLSRERRVGTAERNEPAPGAAEATSTRRTGVRIYPHAAPKPTLGGDAKALQASTVLASVGEMGVTHRSHFDANFARTGARWEEFEPAYRYGDAVRSDIRYSGLGWVEIEPDLRDEWESRNAGPWETFKAAIRHGWERPTRAS